MVKIDKWEDCYDDSWQGEIVPQAFEHPAKFARGLTRRIYAHAIEEGWLQPGDNVIDPFGGIGAGAKDAMRAGLNWTGIELEHRFHVLATGMDCPGFTKLFWKRYQQRGNKKWNKLGICPDCGKMLDSEYPLIFWFGEIRREIPYEEPHHYKGNIETWAAYDLPGTARMYWGDSRQLLSIINENQTGVVSSPPYGEALRIANENTVKRDKEHRANIGRNPESPGSQNFRYDSDTPGQMSTMTQGDFEGVISSPPFQNQVGSHDNFIAPHDTNERMDTDINAYGKAPGQLANMAPGDYDASISSPPFSEPNNQPPNMSAHAPVRSKWKDQGERQAGYGASDGQLGAMDKGDYDGAISSPPFANIQAQPSLGSVNKDNWGKEGKDIAGRRGVSGSYGESDGQLGAMQPGDFEGAISSPPFESGSPHNGGEAEFIDKKRLFGDYGNSAGQLGQQNGETFWMASRIIVENLYKLLKPGAHQIWVLKAYIKNGKIVDFPGQWQKLCETVGFETVHIHHAMLVKDVWTQFGFDGKHKTKHIERKGFFRRLAERRGSPEINYEVVLCMVKP